MAGPDVINSKAAAKAVWQFITGSSVDASNDEQVINALWALHSGNKDLVLDMRAMNGSRKTLPSILFRRS